MFAGGRSTSRSYQLSRRVRLKIFIPIVVLAFVVMVLVNWTNDTLEHSADGKSQHSKLTYNNINKLSISNVPTISPRFWTHIVMAYAFTLWTCYVLREEYEMIATMRLQFLASEGRRLDQFTVLVRNVPPDPDESTTQLVEHFFKVVYNANKLSDLVDEKKKMESWLDFYQLKYTRIQSGRPITKTGFLGLCGKRVYAIDHYTSEVERFSKEPSDASDLSDMSHVTVA